MSNMLVARVEIEGTRPILWHHFGPDALPLEKGERTGVAGNDPEEWRRTVLLTKDRQLYLEPTYVFGSIRDGAKFTKRGRGSIQTAVVATLQVLDERILFDRFLPAEPIPTEPEEPVYLDVRGVRNPATKARNVRYRIACATGWKTAFSLLWDKTVVSRGEMEAVVSDAGRLVGISNGRNIGFGRFTLSDFCVREN
jgi:hypothetical protein